MKDSRVRISPLYSTTQNVTPVEGDLQPGEIFFNWNTGKVVSSPNGTSLSTWNLVNNSQIQTLSSVSAGLPYLKSTKDNSNVSFTLSTSPQEITDVNITADSSNFMIIDVKQNINVVVRPKENTCKEVILYFTRSADVSVSSVFWQGVTIWYLSDIPSFNKSSTEGVLIVKLYIIHKTVVAQTIYNSDFPFVPTSGVDLKWGAIRGDLANQQDLKALLDSKAVHTDPVLYGTVRYADKP